MISQAKIFTSIILRSIVLGENSGKDPDSMIRYFHPLPPLNSFMLMVVVLFLVMYEVEGLLQS